MNVKEFEDLNMQVLNFNDNEEEKVKDDEGISNINYKKIIFCKMIGSI